MSNDDFDARQEERYQRLDRALEACKLLVLTEDPDAPQDVVDEVRDHIDRQEIWHLAGMPPHEAARQAANNLHEPPELVEAARALIDLMGETPSAPSVRRKIANVRDVIDDKNMYARILEQVIVELHRAKY